MCVEEIVFVALGVLLRREQNGTKPGVSQPGAAFRPWSLVPKHLSMQSWNALQKGFVPSWWAGSERKEKAGDACLRRRPCRKAALPSSRESCKLRIPLTYSVYQWFLGFLSNICTPVTKIWECLLSKRHWRPLNFPCLVSLSLSTAITPARFYLSVPSPSLSWCSLP